jgi:hypothetical protein
MSEHCIARLKPGEAMLLPNVGIIHNDLPEPTITIFENDDEKPIYDGMFGGVGKVNLSLVQPSLYLKRNPDGSIDILLCPDGCLAITDEVLIEEGFNSP